MIGAIIGWISLICDIFTFIVSILALVVLCLFGCEDLEALLKENNALDNDFKDICAVGRGGATFKVSFISQAKFDSIFRSWNRGDFTSCSV